MATHQKTGPKIDYPTRWDYRIVGTSEDDIRAHVRALLADVEHELVLGRYSSGGRYVSLNLSLVVRDEAERLAIFDHLARHETVRFVV
ncbi:MAG: putative lipoic acid-binding regulatory protein [Gammaproteobacteria bacterium]|jgi:putative lipoic acid-binding regulatory protein